MEALVFSILLAIIGLGAGWLKCVDDTPKQHFFKRINAKGWIILSGIVVFTVINSCFSISSENERQNLLSELTGYQNRVEQANVFRREVDNHILEINWMLEEVKSAINHVNRALSSEEIDYRGLEKYIKTLSELPKEILTSVYTEETNNAKKFMVNSPVPNGIGDFVFFLSQATKQLINVIQQKNVSKIEFKKVWIT